MSDAPLADYLARWNLKHPTVLKATATSWLFRVQVGDEDAVLKIFTATGIVSESQGSESLRHFAGKGAVRLLNADEGAQLLSFIPGPTLAQRAEEGADYPCADIISQVLQTLHGCTRPGSLPMGFPTMTENFRSLFLNEKKFGQDDLFKHGAEVARDLLKSEETPVVLHGDMHHGNVLFSPETYWLAVDPKPLVGEPAYDTANSFYNPANLNSGLLDMPRIQYYLDVFSARLGIKRERILKYAFAYGCLSACWDYEDGNDPSMTLRLTKIIETLL